MPIKHDLFGSITKAKRGWTELDRIRRRYSWLIGRIANGVATERQMEKATYLKEVIVAREQEASGKWKKSFGS